MAKQNKFGTFGGVFVPSILTILGVIMYLRLPMIVGEAGLWATIGIIIVAHIISATTGLSVSSIATDKKVEAGGTYYMISRSLGLPIGGTLGLALFVGLSFSVSLYLIGFSESFLEYFDFEATKNNIRLTGSIVLLTVTTVTFISTSLAIKTQYFIMAAILLSLISIIFGSHDFTPSVPNFVNNESTISLMVLFGIFFPAVTGFEAGVSMSGDLQDPKKSIPGGSIMAIVVGFVVYIALAFFLAYTVNVDTLTGGSALLKISWIPELVIAGIWGATLSSALGSILGAPRILQATAADKISHRFFAKGYGPTNEPRNALLFTFVIAEAGILIGELDVIARIVSIFFITTYGFLNISAAFEKWTSSDFRPEFKVSGWISVIGAAACILVMIQLDLLAMVGAIVLLSLLFLYLKRKELSLESGDAWSGVWASLVKKGLTNLKKDKLHNRNWRPNIIMFSGEANARTHLVEMGKAVSGKLGILSAFELVKSDNRILAKTESDLSDQDDSTDYFHHKLYCRDVYSGMDQIARVYGFSGIEPNTILMGWGKKPDRKELFIELLESFRHYKYNSIFLNYDIDKKFGNHNTIDIWWSGTGGNLAFAINLMQYITNSSIWKELKIRLLIINPVNGEAENVYKATDAILRDYRVEAEIRVVNNEIDPIPESQIIREESKDTDLCIIGVAEEKYIHLDRHYDEISETLDGIGSALIINSSPEFETFDVLAGGTARTKTLPQEAELQSLELPSLAPSKYPEVAEDITKIDVNGQKVVELFFKKTFLPLIMDHQEMLDELASRVDFADKELDKIIKISDSFRRKKAIDKLENDFLFKVNELFNQKVKEVILPTQTTKLEEGINWYQNRLIDDFKKYPSKLKVAYNKEDFSVAEGDRSGLKMLKRYKNFKHAIVGEPITHQLDYREVARYYQLNNRQLFLDQLLEHFQDEVMAFYNNLRKITNQTISYLDEIEDQIWAGNDSWENKEQLGIIKQRIADESDNQKNLQKIQLGRLQLEYRKNLQLMNKDLEKVDINNLIKKKSRSDKYYKELKLTINEFPENYDLQMKTQLNMILMEISVNAVKSRIEDMRHEFNTMLRQEVDKKYLKSIEDIIQKINKNGQAVDFKKIKFDEGFELPIRQTFVENNEKMMTLVEDLPETMEIYSTRSDQEGHQTISIPVSRMAEYYLKSRYEVTTEEKFEELFDTLKRSTYATKDLINLTQFNLENEDAENSESGPEVLQEAITKLESEKLIIAEKIDEYIKIADEQFDKTFEPLSSMKIEETATDFTADLRSYQSKRVLTGLNQVSQKIIDACQGVLIRLFYSRSTGVLFTKKFTKSKELSSQGSRLLDLKEKVSPSEKILNSLPPYYTNLFNGRSNISNDFWIPRVTEEKAFDQALKRYEQGFVGGILIMGDRNLGKTAFCKYVAQKYLKNRPTYSIFPPVNGVITESEFLQALKKATYKYGSLDHIMGQLEKGSVVIINDLELFWERGEGGLKIVRLIERLIDEYGQRILFVVNVNPHAYKLINRITGFGDKFIENINFDAFDAEGLKNLIMKRHRSSGLSLGLKEGEDDLSEVQQAQLFNSYFTYCEGVPGTALNGWLANVLKVTSDGLVIQKPVYPSITILKDLNEDWTMLLTQFILHKRLDSSKVERITDWSSDNVKSLILAMLRSGIITEKAPGIYHVDPYIQPFLVKALRDKEVL